MKVSSNQASRMVCVFFYSSKEVEMLFTGSAVSSALISSIDQPMHSSIISHDASSPDYQFSCFTTYTCDQNNMDSETSDQNINPETNSNISSGFIQVCFFSSDCCLSSLFINFFF